MLADCMFMRFYHYTVKDLRDITPYQYIQMHKERYFIQRLDEGEKVDTCEHEIVPCAISRAEEFQHAKNLIPKRK